MAGRGRSRLLDLAKLLRVPSRTMRYVRNRTDTTTIVYRDVYDHQLDFAIWTIRDDEVLPLLEVLKSLPVAADLDTERKRIEGVLISLRNMPAVVRDQPVMSTNRVIALLENILVKPKS